MCSCGKPTINGELGYRWQPTDAPSIHPLNPPDLRPGETLVYDEPGRCGGMDSHSFHYRVVSSDTDSLALLVRHGGGDVRTRPLFCIGPALAALDSNGRYWLLNAIYHASSDAARKAQEREHEGWIKAAAEKRIRTRNNSKRGTVKVWIESPITEATPDANGCPMNRGRLEDCSAATCRGCSEDHD